MQRLCPYFFVMQLVFVGAREDCPRASSDVCPLQKSKCRQQHFAAYSLFPDKHDIWSRNG